MSDWRSFWLDFDPPHADGEWAVLAWISRSAVITWLLAMTLVFSALWPIGVTPSLPVSLAIVFVWPALYGLIWSLAVWKKGE